MLFCQSVQTQLLMFLVGYFVLLVCVLVASSKRVDDNTPRRRDWVSRSAGSVSRVGWTIPTTQTGWRLLGLMLTPKSCAFCEVGPPVRWNPPVGFASRSVFFKDSKPD
jgi:hypothetical protein